jgi:ribosomal protein S18 acetylase RimI-like enzyme
MEFELQPARATDADYLYNLHASTMRDVVAATWGWDEAWQRAHFASRFKPERLALIYCDQEVVGVLEVEDRPDTVYVANLQVLPTWQGRGLGTAVMHEVMRRADARGVSVSLQVLERNAGARRLYERLGFTRVADAPPHVQMRR